MDEFAKSIGYSVIVIAIIYVVGKVLFALDEQKQIERDLVLSTWDHERRLAFRKIWQSTNDPRVHEDVKYQYPPWALLELDLSEAEYDRKMATSESSTAYLQACRNVRDKGCAYYLSDGKIVTRPNLLGKSDSG